MKVKHFETLLVPGAYRSEDKVYVYALDEDGKLWCGRWQKESEASEYRFIWHSLPDPGDTQHVPIRPGAIT